MVQVQVTSTTLRMLNNSSIMRRFGGVAAHSTSITSWSWQPLVASLITSSPTSTSKGASTSTSILPGPGPAGSFSTVGGLEKQWKVYLSGEIHSDWREVIAQGVADKGLPVTLTSPNTSHEDSDDCGAIVLGMEEERRNWDKIGANMNAVRTKTLLQDADVVVVRFGEKYRQWNAAFDAGYASALGKPIITLHPPAIAHMLKEVNASANVVCEEPRQVVETLAYVIRGEMPVTPKDGDKYVPIADRLGKGNPNP